MTQLMGRPILGLPSDLDSRSTLTDLLTGVRTALLTLSVVAAPVFGLWVLAPYGDDTAQDAARAVFGLWLLGHGAPLARGPQDAPLTVAPLLLTAVTAVLLSRAGHRQARRARGRGWVRWRSPLTVYAGYLLVAALAVAQCADPRALLHSRAVADLAAVALLAAAGLGHGLWSGLGRPWALPRLPLPPAYWPDGAGAAVGRALAGWLLALAAGGGAVFAVAVLLGSAGQDAQRLGGGAADWLGLLLACLLLVPNGLLWAASYALGVGFAVGTGGHAGPLGTRLGPVPDFPLLTLLPADRGPDWHLLACAAPLAAATASALLLGRAATRWTPAQTAAVAAATALAATGPGLLAGYAAGGAIGPGRMSELGPVPWQFALAQSAWLLAVALPGALLHRWWLGRHGDGAGPVIRARVGAYRLVCRLAA
ncbi:cell division protein PerM [Kitasatospora cineracea]|uniref:cell division protein PerM n=1 Tax=Kitasatospora cineracea TaxID=88074 RepID=UPI0033D64AFC